MPIDDDDQMMPETIEVPIDGVLDLHTFHPRDLRTLIPDYLGECVARGIFSVRIIHGKGTGAVRESVHALLKRDARVERFALADAHAGGWGATLVDLKR
jgi:DNA-nicking Smr family endonuclease